MALRRQVERVAAQRRTLPPGGEVRENYVFEAAVADGKPKRVTLSELFVPDKDTLAIYSFMFGPEKERSCPGCTHFLDGLDGATRHIQQRMNLAVVAKSPLPRILDFAKERGWRWLPLLSTAGNTYDRDYFGDSAALTPAVRKQQEFKDGEEWDMPIMNVFRRDRTASSVTSGAPSFSTCPPSRGKSIATTTCSTHSGTFSISPQRAVATFNPSSPTRLGAANDRTDRRMPMRRCEVPPGGRPV